MTYQELSELPVGSSIVDDSDDDLGVIEAGVFFKVIQWDSGCRTVLRNEGKQAHMKTPFRLSRIAG